MVGATDELTGQAIVGYVILKNRASPTDELVEEIRQHVADKIGPTARPKRVIVVPDLPKTRSGKIMRRLLRDVAEGRDLGDTTTLADPGVVEAIRASAAEAAGQRRVTDPCPRATGSGAPAPSSRGRRSCSTWTGCCRMPRAVSTTSTGPSATGRRSSRRAATTS